MILQAPLSVTPRLLLKRKPGLARRIRLPMKRQRPNRTISRRPTKRSNNRKGLKTVARKRIMKKKRDDRADLCQEFYRVLIMALRYVAERYGYALAVHGSLKRDIDLIACPWRESAPGAESLIQGIQKTVEAIVGTARFREQDKNPESKPCGRLAWAIYLTPDDHGPYLDISVMPMAITKEGH